MHERVQVLDVEEDELDDPEFDPVSYINAKFPNEDALQGIDAFLILSGKQAAALDEEILESVRPRVLRGGLLRVSQWHVCRHVPRSRNRRCMGRKLAVTSNTRKRPSQ